MKKKFTAFAPNGLEIVGTLEHITGSAGIVGFYNGDDGEIIHEYSGSTDVFWNDQRTATTEEGEEIYLDEDGNGWTLSQLTFKEVNE